MFKIVFIQKVRSILEKYNDDYLRYFEELYSDSGIWSQDEILKNYILESKKRYTEIVRTIESKLSHSHISYTDKKTLIKWRSKILLVSFVDSEDIRIITDLDIR